MIPEVRQAVYGQLKGLTIFLYLCERKKGMEKTGELNILENLERKMGALGSCGCLMSLNMMSLSLTIDICRTPRSLISAMVDVARPDFFVETKNNQLNFLQHIGDAEERQHQQGCITVAGIIKRN